MEVREFEVKSPIGKALFAWITLFGMFDTPRDICSVIRNAVIGTPVMLLLLLLGVAFLAMCVAGAIAVPAFIFWGPDSVSIEQMLAYGGQEASACVANYIDDTARASSCYVTQYNLAGTIWSSTVLGISLVLGMSVYIVSVLCIGAYLISDAPSKLMNTPLLKSMKESHKDKICFEVRFK